jgi:hypothetical protein
LGVCVKQGPHRPAPISKKNNMKIELTQAEASELLRAIEAHVKRLNGFIFSTPNEKTIAEFEERRARVESVAEKIQNRL